MKPETEIRNLKRELKRSRLNALDAEAEAARYRNLASSAAQERDEWKARFDVLLRAPYEREQRRMSEIQSNATRRGRMSRSGGA